MKKRIVLLGAVGVGAGLLYLLNRDGRKAVDQGNGNETDQRDQGVLQTAAHLGDGNGNGSASKKNGKGNESDNVIIDDQGTDQFEALNILKHIRDVAFDSNDEKLALALGRPTEEIEEWTSGAGVIDGDVIMKARGLAINRGIEIE